MKQQKTFLLLNVIILLINSALILLPSIVQATGVEDLKVHFDMADGDSWINTGGNFGIGTNSPEAILSLAGVNSTDNVLEINRNNVEYPQNAALNFEQGDVVRITDSAGILSMPDSWTFEAWVKPEEANKRGLILSKMGVPGGANYQLYFTEENKFEVRTERASDDKDFLITSNEKEISKYYHVTGLYNGVQLQIFINGTYEGGLNLIDLNTYTGNDVFQIGGSQAINGIVDEVRIWNRALTYQEIGLNIRNQLNGDEPGLVGYWKFDENSGQQAMDSSGNNLHGTLGNDSSIETIDPLWIQEFNEPIVNEKYTVFTNNGNVGIGTTNPLSTLHVEGDVKFGTSTLNAKTELNHLQLSRVGSPPTSQLVKDSQSFYSYVNDQNVHFYSEQDENKGSHGGFRFIMDDDDDSAPRFSIENKNDKNQRFLFSKHGICIGNC